MGISNLWTAWPVAGPWRISPLVGGTNSFVWRADAVDGQSYVLRLYADLARIPRIRYEAELLRSLSRQDLPFRLPLLLAANDGDRIVLFEQEQGTTALATLSPLLPGHSLHLPSDRHDHSNASRAGSALALLDSALAALPDSPLPDGLQSFSSFGELDRCHPLVSDPVAAVEQLPIDREQAREIRTFLGEVIESVPQLYAQLPQQLLHRDYDPGNILMDQQHVTAVLDFEFAGRDLRIIDLGVALSWWPVQLLGTGKEWGLIDAFGTAYIRQFAVSEEELLALPAVLRLRDATSLVHRLGRYLAGLETGARIQDRLQHSLWREAWLSTHQKTLLDHVLAWK